MRNVNVNLTDQSFIFEHGKVVHMAHGLFLCSTGMIRSQDEKRLEPFRFSRQ